MTVRPDIAELLHAGHSDRAIARQLGVDAIKIVAAARAELRLPKAQPGIKAAATPEDLFWRRVQPTDGGHMTWGGHITNTGTPALRHGGRLHTAYRIAFRIRHGRAPHAYVKPGCGMPGCVAPGHVEEQSDSIEAALARHLQSVDGGHVRWTGSTDTHGVPVVVYQQVKGSVRRAVFRLRYGREPEGPVRAGCGVRSCVAGAHLEDRLMRAANARADRAFAAIFGEAS